MGMIRRLDTKGDTTVVWDVLDEASVVAAKAFFESEVSQGALVAQTVPGSDQAVQVRKFDPQVEEYIAVRQYQGG